MPDSLLIIDELKGRKFANPLGIKITGTIGVIIEAKNAKAIFAVKPLLAKIKATNFRISEELEKHILDKAKE
jgi:predicted nucleic acid-binding protein